MTPRVSRVDFDAIRKMAAEKKAKRVAKGIVLGLRSAQNEARRPGRPRKAVPARKRAFLRLKQLCGDFVLMRTRSRNGGYCEIGIVCGGRGSAEVWYHIFPQAMGNALKYDERNIVGSCHSCNGGEYFARKAGRDTYVKRHKEILGPVYEVIEALKGRREISTVEALEMGDRFKTMIENGDYRK